VTVKFCGYNTVNTTRTGSGVVGQSLLGSNAQRLHLSIGQSSPFPAFLDWQFGPYSAFPAVATPPELTNHYPGWATNTPGGRSFHYNDYGSLVQMETNISASVGSAVVATELTTYDTYSNKVPDFARCYPLYHRLYFYVLGSFSAPLQLLPQNPRRVLAGFFPNFGVGFINVLSSAVSQTTAFLIMNTSSVHWSLSYEVYGDIVGSAISATAPAAGIHTLSWFEVLY